MGKKGKTGKSRKDKFYHLAKETGYRARSAFKLIQLNRKFEFLQKSRVVIDLCAAPGGWLQVVAENTPVSSLIIGVDLVPIRPIPNVSTFQEDITTEKCRQTLRKELQTWKADAVLNDGAPNIGKNWLHDAFQQAELTLEALKLATDFLRKGGWFVTKVFRSKDYNSLMWVFQQLFKKVHATKPQASRNESAEIFVVCEKFLAPDRIDPKFLDPKFVFKEIEAEPKQTINLIHPEKKRRQREGYAEGDYTLFHTLPASNFIQSENFTDLLAEASEIVIDEEDIAKHPATTSEIKACLSDIKVLGKKDIRNLLNWRKKIKKDTERDKKPEKPETVEEGQGEEELESEDEEATLVEKLAELEEDERKALKRKLKKVRKEKTKLRHKMDMKMVIPGDKHDFADDVGLFNLKKIKNKSQLDDVEAGDSNEADALAMEFEADESDDDKVPLKSGKKTVAYSRDNKDHLDMDELLSDSGEEEPDFQYDSADDDLEFEDEDDDSNPLVVSLESKPNQINRRSASWFSKDSFAGLEIDEDEDLELEKMAADYKKRGGKIFEQEKDSGMSDGSSSEDYDDSDDEDDDENSSDSDSESDYDTTELHKQMTSKAKKQNKGKADSKSGFEIVPAGQNLPKLDPVGLAIGSQIVQSRKRRREIIEGSYHRYMFDDSNLPDWFIQDEKKHFRHQLPVSKGDIEEYKMKMKAIDARPIKKIAEAKARKKKKELRRHERARKKAEAISETADITDRDKWQQIKQVYKKAGLLSQKKKEITYVVAKKGVGRRVKRPTGVQGPFRVVDPRMKKDKRSMNAQNKGKGQRGKQKFSKSNRGKKKK